MRIRAEICCVAALLLSAPALAQMKEGQWQIKTHTEPPNNSTPVDDVSTSCVTPEQMAEFEEHLNSAPTGPINASHCKQETTQQGDRTIIDRKCPGGMSLHIESVKSATHFTANVTALLMQGMTIKSTTEGTYLGPCAK